MWILGVVYIIIRCGWEYYSSIKIEEEKQKVREEYYKSKQKEAI